MPIYSCYQGLNSDLIRAAADLYLKPGDWICDPTWGKGVFWKKVNLSHYTLTASDKVTCPNAPWDCRHLPHSARFFDVVVLDLPYAHNPGQMIVDGNYKNAQTTKGMYHVDIMRMYFDSMREAKRILKPEGMLWVKTQDEVESSFQRWSHIEIYLMAVKLGFFGKDLFVLMQQNRPVIQHKRQQHARKCHSYLWVFKLPSAAEKHQLKKHKIWT